MSLLTTFPAKDLEQGEEIQIQDSGGQDITYAEVLDMWSGPLSHLPACLLEMSHDPLSRTFTGAHTSLMLKTGQPVALDAVVSILVIKPKTSTILRASAQQIAAQGGSLQRRNN